MMKSLMRLIPAVLGAALLGGCLEPRTEWAKDGADADELRYVRAMCEREASGYTFMDEDLRSDRTTSRDRGSSSARSDVYRRCMEGQGWRRQRTDQAKTSSSK